MKKPKYPVYVISKGRADTCLTANFLLKDKVNFRLVIEPQEYDKYAKHYDSSIIITTPFKNLGLGSIPVRNFVWEHSKSIGAKNIINSSDLNKEARPLDKGMWDGAIDTVGGNILSKVLSHIKETGIVAACGNASSIKLNTPVMPFIIRGIKLWGINSVNTSIKRRQFLWEESSKLIDFALLETTKHS